MIIGHAPTGTTLAAEPHNSTRAAAATAAAPPRPPSAPAGGRRSHTQHALAMMPFQVSGADLSLLSVGSRAAVPAAKPPPHPAVAQVRPWPCKQPSAVVAQQQASAKLLDAFDVLMDWEDWEDTWVPKEGLPPTRFSEAGSDPSAAAPVPLHGTTTLVGSSTSGGTAAGGSQQLSRGLGGGRSSPRSHAARKAAAGDDRVLPANKQVAAAMPPPRRGVHRPSSRPPSRGPLAGPPTSQGQTRPAFGCPAAGDDDVAVAFDEAALGPVFAAPSPSCLRGGGGGWACGAAAAGLIAQVPTPHSGCSSRLHTPRRGVLLGTRGGRPRSAFAMGRRWLRA